MKKQPIVMILLGGVVLLVVGLVMMLGLGIGFKSPKASQATIAIAPTPAVEATAEAVIGDAATLNADGSSNVQVAPNSNLQQKPSSNTNNIVVHSSSNNNSLSNDKSQTDSQLTQSVENQAAEAFQAKDQKKKTTTTVMLTQDGKTTVVVSKKENATQESDERTKKLTNKNAGLDEIADEFSH